MVCTKCGTKVNKRGNLLLPPSQSVIKNHWLGNKKCISGCPDSEKASKSLDAELRDIRLNAYQEPATLAKVAEEHFPVNSEERNAFICGKCLFYTNTRQNFIKHFGTKNKLGCIQSPTPIYCNIVKGKYDISIPKEMLNRIKNGHKITKRGEWNLQFNPSNLPEELQHLYQIIGRNSNDLGGTRIVCKTESTTIFGEITKASMQSVVSSLIKNTQLSNTCRILDIGSGLGQPTMHCYIHGVALSYGIEVSIMRHVSALEILEKVLEADRTIKKNKIYPTPKL